ncbi:MAG: hypothetical protein KA746_01100 [Pyrinomonadaceae bacterium]|nr:hypothetical protein [Pyrinomonadaceae bacterium]
MKRIFLTIFALFVTLASFSVLAGNMAPLTAPALFGGLVASRARQAAAPGAASTDPQAFVGVETVAKADAIPVVAETVTETRSFQAAGPLPDHGSGIAAAWARMTDAVSDRMTIAAMPSSRTIAALIDLPKNKAVEAVSAVIQPLLPDKRLHLSNANQQPLAFGTLPLEAPKTAAMTAVKTIPETVQPQLIDKRLHLSNSNQQPLAFGTLPLEAPKTAAMTAVKTIPETVQPQLIDKRLHFSNSNQQPLAFGTLPLEAPVTMANAPAKIVTTLVQTLVMENRLHLSNANRRPLAYGTLSLEAPVTMANAPAKTVTTLVQPLLPDKRLHLSNANRRPLAYGILSPEAPMTMAIGQVKGFPEVVQPLLIDKRLHLFSANLMPVAFGTLTMEAPKTMARTAVNTVPPPMGQPTPLLIGRNPGFSLEMLKPLGSTNGLSPKIGQLPAVGTVEGSFCDPNFIGPPIRFSQTIELKLDDLLSQLHGRFGINFIVGTNIGDLPMNIKAGSIPWNILLRSQLYISGVRAVCIDSNTIELILNDKVADLEKSRVDAERLESRYIKLKYLQPSSSGNRNIAGQSTSSGFGQGGLNQNQCQSGTTGIGGVGQMGGQNTIPQRCKFERLMNEIRQILGLDEQGTVNGSEAIKYVTPTKTPGDAGYGPTVEASKRPYVGQVPGRNMLIVNASASQLRDIEELIKHADVPPFQVIIKGLIYTANEDKLRDIGVQTTIADTGSGRTTGGVFGHTLGSLGTLFDFSTLVGTIDFNVQANALQRDGVISIKARPFATVLDGDTTDLTVGRQVPVVIQGTNLVGGAPGTLEILQAANLLSVTPHVIDDENGKPVAVNLELQLESNEVDATVDSQGVPAVSVRSIQSNFIINLEQTAILGGFTVDSDNRTVSKTPGLGDIPILGELFKRRVRSSQINRLYFAISVVVIPYGGTIEPVSVPGAGTDPPTITPAMLKRAEMGEPKAVPTPTPKPTPN